MNTINLLSFRFAVAMGLLSSLIVLQNAGAQNYEGRSIAEVRIEGLERVSEQVLRAKLEVQAGQSFNRRAIARDLRRLYELGYFTNIKADATLTGDALTITYRCEEKRVVSEIKIVGNHKMKSRRIRGVLTMREGDSFVAEAYDEERDAILALYESKGYANTTVDIVAEKAGASRVSLTYLIEEGKKARIRSIALVGNESLRDHKLLKLMKTKRAWWFLGGKYEEEKFEADLEAIIDEYGNHGRLEADIPKTDLVYTPSGKGMNVTIYLEEGPEYQLETLEVAENTVYDDDEVLNIVEVQAGEVHNKGQVLEDAALVEKGYQDSGYVNAKVTPQVTLDREKKTTHVVHHVEEQDLRYVRQINVTGNEVTRDDVIRREMLIKPGDRFDGAAVKGSERRLRNTRYFDEVRVTLEDVEDSDLFTDLWTDVEEGKTGNFNFGAGFNTEEGVSGFTELRFTNFDITNWPKFSGGGQQLRLKLNLGETRDEYSLSFTEPEIGGYPVAFGFDIYDESYKVTGGADYREDAQGAQLRFGKALSPYVTARASFKYQETNISDLPFFVNREIRNQRGENTTLSTRWQIERNTLDNYRDPSSGAKHNLALEVAGLGGDYDFVKLEHDSTWVRAFGKKEKWVLSFRSRQGWATEYGDSDYLPLQDRFYAGGTTTVRGYENRDIGPKVKEYTCWGDDFAVGGNIRLVNNLELKYKATDMFRLYAFIDSGSVHEDAGDFDLGDTNYGAGIGMGVDVPRMGPIRLDYGIPLNPDEDQSSSGRLHLQTGFSF